MKDKLFHIKKRYIFLGILLLFLAVAFLSHDSGKSSDSGGFESEMPESSGTLDKEMDKELKKAVETEDSQASDSYDRTADIEAILNQDYDVEGIRAESRVIAEQFMSAYYKRAPDYDYVAAVKDLTKESYYEYLTGNVERQTLDREKQSIESMVFEETEEDVTVNHVSWYVVVQGAFESYDGTVVKSEDHYLVMLNKIKGEWRVAWCSKTVLY